MSLASIPVAGIKFWKTVKVRNKASRNKECSVFVCSRPLTSVIVASCHVSKKKNLFVHLCYLLPEIHCLPPPVVPSAMQDGGGTRAESRVHYACAAGMRFADGYTEKTVECQLNEEWNETGLDCAGKANQTRHLKVSIGSLGALIVAIAGYH